MDAVQFGRWLSDRRRRYGWRSQRALVETIGQDALLKDSGISEDFLARLEAGQLAQPFRGNVRKRVFALAGLLCRNLRDLHAYLQAAELTDLSAEEEEYVKRVRERLGTKRTSTISLLPPRPLRLMGREEAIHDVSRALCRIEAGLCALTGMPGVGKSVLAYEVLHALTTQQREQCFPDGIATFKCTGRRGQRGLATLLHEIITFFSPAPRLSTKTEAGSIETLALRDGTPSVEEIAEADLTALIDRVHLVLAGKRVLLFLDDLDAHFPLRQALDALLMQEYKPVTEYGSQSSGSISRVVLTTSRYIPPPTLTTYHLHVPVLEPAAASDLFIALLGRQLSEAERADVQRICAAVGNLPLAVEAAAASVMIAGVPLSLLAERATKYPLDRLLDAEGEIQATLTQAFGNFEQDMQKQFVLLSALGSSSFGLESAAVLQAPKLETNAYDPITDFEPPLLKYTEKCASAPKRNGNGHHTAELPLLTDTAAYLGQLVRHSFVEIVPPHTNGAISIANRTASPHYPQYRMHPLLYTYAMDRLEQLEPEVVRSAQRNASAYALAYVEHYWADIEHFQREQEFLLAVLLNALQQKQYSLVIRMLSQLLPLMSRLGSYEKAKQVLHWGIYACEQTNNRSYQALFLSYLGGLLGHSGDFAQARRILGQSLEITETLERGKQVWMPLTELSHIACILGEREAAHAYIETYLRHSERDNNIIGIASGLYMRGFYRRLDGSRDKADADVTASLNLFPTNMKEEFCEDTFIMALRVEQARIRDEYTLARQHGEAMYALARRTEDPYITADFLFDQACFALQHGMLEDARTLLLRVVETAKQIGANYLYKRAVNVMHQLPSL